MRLFIAVPFLLLFVLTLTAARADEKGAKAIFYSGDGPTVLTGSRSDESAPAVTDTDADSVLSSGEDPDEEDWNDDEWTAEDDQAMEDLLAGDETASDTVADDTTASNTTVSDTTVGETPASDTAAQAASTRTTPARPAPRRVSSTGPPAVTQRYMGISYWIEQLNPDGTTTRVSPNKTFRSGDRIKLNVESNSNGYLYVLNIGSSGNSHVLFPNPGVASNAIIAGLPYSVPFQTYMRFDNNPGEEILMLMLSPRPMGSMAPAGPSYGPMDNRETDRFMRVASAKGAKDIILEDVVSGPSPATYVVAPVSTLDSKVITVQIKLKHR